MLGLGLGIIHRGFRTAGNPSDVPEILASMEERSTYYENEDAMRASMLRLENCEDDE